MQGTVPAGDLEAEVARLLRARRGELAEPLGWDQPWLRWRVQAVLRQLEPIRSRDALASSWEREAQPGPEVRLAYAMTWLALDRRRSAGATRRRRNRATLSPSTHHA